MKKYIFYGLVLVNLVYALQQLNEPDVQRKGEMPLMVNQDWIRIVPPSSTNPLQTQIPLESERGESSVGEVDSMQEAQPVSDSVAAAECWVLDDLDDYLAARLELILAKAGFVYRTVRHLENTPAGHIVLLGPFETEAEGLAARKRAIAAGFSDAVLLTAGRWKNSVSVGIFSNLDNARRQQKRARESLPDLPVNIAQRFKRKTKNTVYVRADGGVSAPSELLNRVGMTATGKKWQKNACEGVEFSSVTK